jgi:diguanylate cyclase (GGDEF)-like protein/PAS domain S-box-containing protein
LAAPAPPWEPPDSGRPDSRYHALRSLTGSPVLVLDWPEAGAPGRVLEASPAARRLLGREPDSGEPLAADEVLAEPEALARLVEDLRPGQELEGAVELRRPDGGRVEARAACRLLQSARGASLMMVLRAPAADPLELTMAVLDSSLEAVAVLDGAGRIQTVNPTFAFLTGWPADEAVGRDLEALYRSGRNGPQGFAGIWRQALSRGRFSGEVWGRRRNGEIYPQWLTLTRAQEGGGGPERYVALFHDLSEARRNQERVRFLSQFDVLTGLPNRILLRDRLGQAVARARRAERSGCLLCLDVDNFRTVNDGLGHALGDQLLQGLALRLERCLRQEDTVARTGGDEFALVMADVEDPDAACRVAGRVQEAVSEPFSLEGREIFATLSIGGCLFPADGEEGDLLMRHAEIAMYRAKEQGRGSFRLFTPAMNRRVERRLAAESQLRRAIERREFVVHYQPRVELATGRVRALEALLRWRRPSEGLVSPAEFVPLAEETGLIVPLGEWVLGEACRQLRQWRSSLQADLAVSVNLSARQLLWQHDVVSLVEEALATQDLPPEALELEVTESVVMHNLEGAVATLTRLREMGVRLAMDDFGTGYSSLKYLRQFPLDYLKIDRSFVSRLPDHPQDAAIVSGIIALGRRLGLRVVAEGVESEAQRDFLRGQGCHEMQGFLFSPALDPDQAARFLGAGPAPAGPGRGAGLAGE